MIAHVTCKELTGCGEGNLFGRCSSGQQKQTRRENSGKECCAITQRCIDHRLNRPVISRPSHPFACGVHLLSPSPMSTRPHRQSKQSSQLILSKTIAQVLLPVIGLLSPIHQTRVKELPPVIFIRNSTLMSLIYSIATRLQLPSINFHSSINYNDVYLLNVHCSTTNDLS